ncbi:VMAP-C domain-containing protein [Marinitenerispora sediminis]|uniref:VMAP-C domain-containing protein n=1 Tax=Marinitenerispora sediminis TaxID=1931232 RepID=UPI0011C05905|nr:trypsin-like peptidase domain-containing protein [Marinitenerispora sediminis]
MRVLATDGHGGTAPVGGGTLLPEGRLLTCAHVVRDALGVPRTADGGRPGTDTVIEIDSPVFDSAWRGRATVEEWYTEGPIQDIAVLRLADVPPGLAHARLSLSVEQARETDSIHVVGYPRDSPYGLRAGVRVRDPGGNRAGRVQLDIAPDSQARIERGFSGCAVLDAVTGAVLGVLVSTSVRADGTVGLVGWMIPIRSIPRLSDLVPVARPLTVGAVPEDLLALLSDLNFVRVEHAYASAVDDRYVHDIRWQLPTAWAALSELDDLPPREDGVPRLLIFLEEAAHSVPYLRRRLRAWSDVLHPRHSAHIADLRARGPQPADGDAEPARLVIRAEPLDADTGPPPSYLVSHWLGVGRPDRVAQADYGEPRKVATADVPSRVLELIRRAEEELGRRSGRTDRLRVECFLPVTLLGLAVESWKVGPTRARRAPRLGARFEVVLRSWERAYEPDYRPHLWRWQHRWRRLSEGGGRVYWAPDRDHPAELPDELEDIDIVACVLGDGPADEAGLDDLYVALEAGIPVIVWRRAAQPETPEQRKANEIGFRGLLRSLIAADDGLAPPGSHVRELPRSLRNQRVRRGKRASGETELFDPYHVALLYDDPTRIPGTRHSGSLHTPPRTVTASDP